MKALFFGRTSIRGHHGDNTRAEPKRDVGAPEEARDDLPPRRTCSVASEASHVQHTLPSLSMGEPQSIHQNVERRRACNASATHRRCWHGDMAGRERTWWFPPATAHVLSRLKLIATSPACSMPPPWCTPQDSSCRVRCAMCTRVRCAGVRVRRCVRGVRLTAPPADGVRPVRGWRPPGCSEGGAQQPARAACHCTRSTPLQSTRALTRTAAPPLSARQDTARHRRRDAWQEWGRRVHRALRAANSCV